MKDNLIITREDGKRKTPRIEELSIVAVWHTLGGAPLRGNRGRAWFRDGEGYNVQLYPATGTWHDFATGTGGGIMALVEVALGCDRRGALEWLTGNFGIASNNHSPSERREFARRHEAARAVAERLIERRDEAFNEIREERRQRLEEYHQLNRAAHEAEDIELLARAADIWCGLETLDAEGDALLTEANAAALEELLSERRAG